jgi:YARHG domain
MEVSPRLPTVQRSPHSNRPTETVSIKQPERAADYLLILIAGSHLGFCHILACIHMTAIPLRRAASMTSAETLQAATPAVDIASLPTCERLCYQRNAIFHNIGYCFSTGKGLVAFGNTNCFCNQGQTWEAMGESNHILVNQIREQERANSC